MNLDLEKEAIQAGLDGHQDRAKGEAKLFYLGNKYCDHLEEIKNCIHHSSAVEVKGGILLTLSSLIFVLLVKI